MPWTGNSFRVCFFSGGSGLRPVLEQITPVLSPADGVIFYLPTAQFVFN